MGISSSRDIPHDEKPEYKKYDSKCSSIVFQGYRIAMEDHVDVKKADNGLWLAIYDGHGGDACAQYLKDSLLNNLSLLDHISSERVTETFIETERNFRKYLKDESIKDLEDLKGTSKEALERAFHQSPSEEPKIDSLYIRTPKSNSGSCATVAHINNNILTVANSGDCVALLVFEDGTFSTLSDLHRPKLLEHYETDFESQRIYAAGLSVQECRVNGELAVSRSFGDFEYKGFAKDEYSQAVTCVPFVCQIPLRSNDKYLVLFSDGLESVEPREIADIVSSSNDDETKLKLLIEKSYKDTRDNVSIILYSF